MSNNPTSVAPALGPPALGGQRVLLVTDRPFMEPVDGSSHTYLMWLQVLNDLGCRVSVLSFDRKSMQWSKQDRAALATATVGSLILEARGSRASALLDEAAATAWRSLAGRRYLPETVETLLRRGQRDRLAAFMHEGAFSSVVLNKLHTTALVGRRLFRSIAARKIIDMHDNYPMREALNRKVLWHLLRTDKPAFRMALKVKDLVEMASWAGQRRKLAEEVRLLADFDHVVFNAREEAEIYVGAGLERSKVALLPLPRPGKSAPATEPAPGGRPYQVGLIASASLSNIEALHFLLQRIMPRLKARGARLLVAGTIGRYAKPLMTPEDGAVLGWIEDVSSFYEQVEVVLVPLLTGTGVSVKTMEAAAHGAAIVTTKVGLRGLDLQPGVDLLMSDDADEFAASVLRVLDDAHLRAGLRRNALDGLNRHHSRDAFEQGVARLLTPNGL